MQLVTSIGLFLAGCAAMHWAYQMSYPLALGLAVLTGGLLVRVFIVQHDCGHGAFFVSRRSNDAVGLLCSLLTLTPYALWRRHHAAHHGNWNNLDRRLAVSDIYSSCLTVDEYLSLPLQRRLLYRLSHHPLVANLLLPPLIFLLAYRVPFDTPASWKRERRAVYLTNLVIAALFVVAGLTLGFQQVLLLQLPVVAVASIVGVGLFAIQHRFPGVVWARQPDWNFAEAALHGSAFLRLPRLLQWFTGNIGFHHVHHLEPRIPNYRLQACHEALPAIRATEPVSFRGCLQAFRLTLWDEERERMVGFAGLRGLALASHRSGHIRGAK